MPPRPRRLPPLTTPLTRLDGLPAKGLRLATGFAVLAAVLWLGGQLARWTGLPVPPAILGMVLLLIALGAFGHRLAPTVEAPSMPMLKHLMLFFIPSVVGVMEQFHALRAGWLPFVVASIAGAALTLAVTALTLQWLLKRRGVAA